MRAEDTNDTNGGGYVQVAGGGEEGDYLDPTYELDQEARAAREREEQQNGLQNVPPRDPTRDYPASPSSQQLRDFDQWMKDMEQLGGGAPRSVTTPKGAPQFIFPNGMILRFDLEPGQYLPGQGPHINLQNAPGAPQNNLHIDLAG